MLANKKGVQFSILFHLQEEGLAFRYELPVQQLLPEKVNILSEVSGFALMHKQEAWMQEYQTAGVGSPSYELLYEKVTVGDDHSGRSLIGRWLDPLLKLVDYEHLGTDGWAMPALFKQKKHYVMLAESNIDGNYPGSHLAGEVKGLEYRIEFPHADEGLGIGEHLPVATLPLKTPWRVIKAGTLQQIVESTLITDIADPLDKVFANKLPKWVKPAPVAWDWWDELDTGDLAQQKRYVDAAEQLGWPYVLVDASWNSWNNSKPEASILELTSYAASKGVDILLWYNSGGEHNNFASGPRDILNDAQVRSNEMAKLKRWGVKGIKIDFFQSDKQFIMQLYLDILADAAANQLMVNVHGSTIPRGWRRRFPNLMTSEAVRGAEYYQFPVLAGPSANDNVYYSLIRNVVGPMDYTPVVFETALVQEDISYAHSLALTIAFESALHHFADESDNPEKGYQKVIAEFPFVGEFMKDVPTAWDETKLLSGDPDSHSVFARRKGEIWYIGAISANEENLTLDLPLTFLGQGKYQAKLITQGSSSRKFKFRELSVNMNNTIPVSLSPNGGLVIRLEKLESN